ncbi:hypothetical protein SASPL_132528 [Salvia splendens]|uniref:Uncharacterized protein n=1 Tax=Salvia splendens TaxID=180675 RepID=A0A8X8ZHF7_SALSN|nr:hypothetical protein SASPL_132528 [Salvia splendens]
MAISRMFQILIVIFLHYLSASILAANPTYNVFSYGAKVDGKSDCTKAFQAPPYMCHKESTFWEMRISTAARANIMPQPYRLMGLFQPQRITMSSVIAGPSLGPCDRTGPPIFRGLGNISANIHTWEPPVRVRCSSSTNAATGTSSPEPSLIASAAPAIVGHCDWEQRKRINLVTGVSICGGTLDGQDTNLWACKASGKKCPKGATSSGVMLNYKNKAVDVVCGNTIQNMDGVIKPLRCLS